MGKCFWRIIVEEHMKTLFSSVVYSGQITEKKLEKLLRTLFAKYILTPEEILSNLCKKNTLRFNNLFEYNRVTEKASNSRVRISYLAQSSGISITIVSIYEDELSFEQKKKINETSSLKLK